MDLKDLDPDKLYTYADYLEWKFEERVELLKGKIFQMGAPGSNHQRVSKRLFSAINNYLTGRNCEVFYAPFDVRIPRKSADDKDIITVFQPDLCVICDPTKIDEKGCLGAPDIVIEILSPGNNKKELKYKFDIYEEAGVKEYWIADPREKSVQIFLLINGKYSSEGYLIDEDKITSNILPGFSMIISELFLNI